MNYNKSEPELNALIKPYEAPRKSLNRTPCSSSETTLGKHVPTRAKRSHASTDASQTSIACAPPPKKQRRCSASDLATDSGFLDARTKWAALATKPLRPNYCRARTWRGVQCEKAKQKNSEYCFIHTPKASQNVLPYGIYDPSVPPEHIAKLIDRAAVCEQNQGLQYYSRDRMWFEAKKHDVACVEELSDADMTLCLAAVNDYYKMYSAKRHEHGVMRFSEFKIVPDLMYVGSSVRNYRYYAPTVFNNMLHHVANPVSYTHLTLPTILRV